MMAVVSTSESASDTPSGGVARRDRLRMTAENRYGVVFLLILVTYGVSASSNGAVGSTFVVVLQLVTVWIALTVSESHRLRKVAGFVIVLVAAAAGLGAFFGVVSEGSNAITGAVYLLNAVLYLFAPILILAHLFRRGTVDLQSFLGAIDAYLLIGMMFAFSYRALGEFQAASFFGANGDGTISEDLFFSFITLTTTGYGNLVPASNPGQSFAVTEAITGQLFLVTAVAKIVTAWNPGVVRRAKLEADGALGDDPGRMP